MNKKPAAKKKESASKIAARVICLVLATSLVLVSILAIFHDM